MLLVNVLLLFSADDFFFKITKMDVFIYVRETREIY